jgi:long-chain acyl-CoA synthetase
MISVDSYRGWRSLTHMFFETADRLGDRPFLWAKRDGRFQPLSWRETADAAGRLSRGLRAHGIGRGDRVAIVAENRPEWLIGEIAVLAAGAIAVPAYTTNTPDDHRHILNNSGAKAAIVSRQKLADALLPAALKSASCKLVVTVEPLRLSQTVGQVRVVGWQDLLAEGAALPDDVRAEAAKSARTDTAVIIHTSGTGGVPRGVMLSHGAIIANCMGAYHLLQDHLDYDAEVLLSFLPLSHSYEHMAGQFLALSVGAQIYYAESVDHLVANMAEVRPTIMTAVPRLYEVMHARIQRATATTTGLKKWLFDKALELGRKRYEAPGSLTLGERLIDAVVERLVRAKVRRRFGGRLKFFVSGGAPLNHDIGLYFTALGVRLLQGYGLTEASPVISANPPVGYKIHTVGPPLYGVEVRIADDGEILVRGENVMQGYYGDETATRQVIRDGWLHTGDIGVIDGDGHIQITDRKKDIIINSGGDNVAPQRVEGFLTLQPEIAQAMVYGDRRPHLVALIVPDAEMVAGWARKNGRAPGLAAVIDDPQFRELIAEAVARVNKQLGNAERVRRFALAREEFSVANGMMTPSLKIRRHVIKKTYEPMLEALYDAKG